MSSRPLQRERYAAEKRLAGAVVCALGLFYAGPIAAEGGPVHSVVIKGVKYEPAVVVVKRGDTVVWLNKDPFPHTVTAKGIFNSADIAPGKSWKYTARRVGEYSYTCTLHPNMKGTLKVE